MLPVAMALLLALPAQTGPDTLEAVDLTAGAAFEAALARLDTLRSVLRHSSASGQRALAPAP
jgi:hypothetical protein